MEKKYFSISEVSDMLNVPASTLRYWEQEIPKLRPLVSARGIRRYTDKDIVLLKLIIHLINDKHLTLEGVRNALNKDVDAMSNLVRITDRLKSVRDELVAIRRELNEHEALADEVIIDE